MKDCSQLSFETCICKLVFGQFYIRFFDNFKNYLIISARIIRGLDFSFLTQQLFFWHASIQEILKIITCNASFLLNRYILRTAYFLTIQLWTDVLHCKKICLKLDKVTQPLFGYSCRIFCCSVFRVSVLHWECMFYATQCICLSDFSSALFF